MWRAVFAISVSLFLAAAALFAAGCGSGADTSDEVGGKPVMIDFWQPG